MIKSENVKFHMKQGWKSVMHILITPHVYMPEQHWNLSRESPRPHDHTTNSTFITSFYGQLLQL